MLKLPLALRRIVDSVSGWPLIARIAWHLASHKLVSAVGAFAALAAAGFLCLYWELIWNNLYEDHERMRNLALIFVAVFGLLIAGWRSFTAHWQAETAQSSLLNERYQKATEMLGGKRAARLVGIHALIRMAQRHKDYHVLIMFALSAFVRTRAKRKPEHEHDANREGLPRDLVAVMEALADRSGRQLITEIKEEYYLDLRNTDLRGLLVAEAKLPRALLDDANLSDRGNVAILGRANFVAASLVSANLASARVYGADFTDADLSGAKLTATYLFMVDFSQADLADTDFSGADFNGNVAMKDAILDGTVLVNVAGLTQEQLNSAEINPGRPPILTGSRDSETGRPLVIPN